MCKSTDTFIPISHILAEGTNLIYIFFKREREKEKNKGNCPRSCGRDPLLGRGPPVEKRCPRMHICDEC